MENSAGSANSNKEGVLVVAKNLLSDIKELQCLTLISQQARTEEQKLRMEELAKNIAGHGSAINNFFKTGPLSKERAFGLFFDCKHLPKDKSGFIVLAGETENLIKKLGG